MREFVDLGATTPPMEDCAQLGRADYAERAKAEANALIAQLRRLFGMEPDRASLRIKSHEHDFGIYYTVVCCYDTDDPVAAAYAFRCDDESPLEWDDEARKSLGLPPPV